ncbi:hypothetical protein RKE30_01330 [Streptomyces sp. Li-HN-5-11]|uniref:hypothetical protein n=1 Tax=Streptomyces sp. Li-HN-5-11 TaxID=3075432 RepID=UPI0028A8068D|nr:hypothetical protein [Streptomyces sp. Li-HN-5-11]WNM29137.1 hypothetical protein RKE30_01330 [Streptomyces sp. Li-HN-5-11]
MNHSPDDQNPRGFDSDELDLRRMLHQAVRDVEPSTGALEQLRRAVPARRARKRQAAVGMAAAALFLGTAVPALVHVSDTSSDADPAIAGQASQTQGGTGQDKGPDGGAGTAGGSSGKVTGKDPGGPKDDPKGGRPTGNGSGPGGAASPSASLGTGAPACTASQLGSATGSVGAPDAAGAVYGTFRVSNVSSSKCAVGDSGTVSVLAQGAADPTRITVVKHTAADAATGLPNPATEVSGLVLAPGSAYEVKFAWLPSQTCPAGGGSGSGSGGTQTGRPTPDPTPSQGATGPTPGSDTGATTQLVEDGGTADGSVVVSLTPAAGSPTVSATVPNACVGTVYRTGVLTAS